MRASRHRYRTLPLIPVDAFLADHPEHATSSDHELTIARIQHEHTARQALEEQRQRLLRQKEALLRETAGKKEELGKLDAEIEKWVSGQQAVRALLDAHDHRLVEAGEKEEAGTAAQTASMAT